MASNNMAVRKIRKSWWVDFRFKGTRYRRRSPDNSQAGAKAYELVLRQRLANGEPLDDSEKQTEQKQTFEEFAWKWFEIYVKNNNKYGEIVIKRYNLKAHLIPYFGKILIGEIKDLQVEGYKAKKISKGLSNKTINNHLTVLSKCLKTAQEWLDLEKIPKIKRLKVPPQKFDFLSYQEAELLLNYSRSIWHEMILVSLKTGLRLGELRGLDWSDINWENATLTVRRSLCGFRNIIEPTKNHKVRFIPLVSSVCDVLGRRSRKNGFIFTDKNGEPFRKKRLYYQLNKICQVAHLRKIGWHTFRHTFASHLAMRGVPLKFIQEFLGHSDIRMTFRYSHLTRSSLSEAINVLESNGDKLNFWATGGQHQGKRPDNCKRIALPTHEILANNSKKGAEAPLL